MNTDSLKDLINQINAWDNSIPNYILFLPREPQGYVKELIEEYDLEYKIIGEPTAKQCGIDMDTVLVVPSNLYKPIKIAWEGYKNDTRETTV